MPPLPFSPRAILLIFSPVHQLQIPHRKYSAHLRMDPREITLIQMLPYLCQAALYGG